MALVSDQTWVSFNEENFIFCQFIFFLFALPGLIDLFFFISDAYFSTRDESNVSLLYFGRRLLQLLPCCFGTGTDTREEPDSHAAAEQSDAVWDTNILYFCNKVNRTWEFYLSVKSVGLWDMHRIHIRNILVWNFSCKLSTDTMMTSMWGGGRKLQNFEVSFYTEARLQCECWFLWLVLL